MEQMLIVTLREGLESFLIVAIAAAYLRKTGRSALLPAVWWGTLAAVALSTALGVWLAEVAVQPLWEGVMAAVAAVLVISMVIYMQRVGRHLRGQIGDRLEVAAQKPGTGAWLGVFLFVLLMITREGMEMAFITATLLRTTGLSDTALGALFGIVLAAGLAWAWIRYGHRVNLGLFFQVTSLFLALFGAQLVLYAFHELTEAGALPLIDNQYWHDATEVWAQGVYGQVFTVALIVIPVTWLVITLLRRRKPEVAVGSARTRAGSS